MWWDFNNRFAASLPMNLPVKKFKNQLRFDRIMATRLWSHFLAHPVQSVTHGVTNSSLSHNCHKKIMSKSIYLQNWKTCLHFLSFPSCEVKNAQILTAPLLTLAISAIKRSNEGNENIYRRKLSQLLQ